VDLKKRVKGFLDFNRLFKHLDKEEAKSKWTKQSTAKPAEQKKEDTKK
jgi:hypothetical protein